MSLNYALGSKLYHARTERGLTQAQVASAADISVRWYQKLEKGTFLPGTVVAFRLLIILGINPNDFRKEVGLIDDLPVSSR